MLVAMVAPRRLANGALVAVAIFPAQVLIVMAIYQRHSADRAITCRMRALGLPISMMASTKSSTQHGCYSAIPPSRRDSASECVEASYGHYLARVQTLRRMVSCCARC